MNLDSSFPQFYETGLEDLCGYAVLKGIKPKGVFKHHDKPLTGFKPAHRSFAEISLNHLATGAEGGERENTNKNLSP